MRPTSQGAVEALLEGDSLADDQGAGDRPVIGTASELLKLLNERVPEYITKRKGWFSHPRQVSDALKRLVQVLRRVGVLVRLGRTGRSRSDFSAA